MNEVYGKPVTGRGTRRVRAYESPKCITRSAPSARAAETAAASGSARSWPSETTQSFIAGPGLIVGERALRIRARRRTGHTMAACHAAIMREADYAASFAWNALSRQARAAPACLENCLNITGKIGSLTIPVPHIPERIYSNRGIQWLPNPQSPKTNSCRT